MNSIVAIAGHRLRALRQQRGYTQEEMAERAELHTTYIGQVERGEKNLTLLSMEKLLSALGVSFSEFFEYIEEERNEGLAAKCYEIISRKSSEQQARIFRILNEIDELTT